MDKGLYWIVLLSCASLLSCSAKRESRIKAREVPISIIIKGTDPDLTTTDLNYYMYKCLDELERFQRIELISVEPDENPEITLELDIENFTIWPKTKNVARRVFSRRVVVGQDAKGNPIYGVVRGSADIVQEQWRVSVRFDANFKIKGAPGKIFSRVFSPDYRRQYVYVENIQGDNRALDPSLFASRQPPF